MSSSCAELRDALRPHIIGLRHSYTHDVLPAVCRRLGLPAPNIEGSKADRLEGSFDLAPDSDLLSIAERYLASQRPSARIRNEIQDLIWTGSCPRITKRARREIARKLGGVEFYLDARKFDQLLDRLWILDDDLDAWHSGQGLREQIERHVHRNPDDWSWEELFDNLKAFESGDRRFLQFLEGLASSDVRPDLEGQLCFVEMVNEALRQCGIELRQVGESDGYPLFAVCAISDSATGKPKNLIFASSVKPDLRFKDAVNNDIEIVTNADKVLVYDREIGVEGLRWSDLQDWWQSLQGDADPNVSKVSLYRRLRSSLPENSPPQATLFDAYHKQFGAYVPRLPALLPEVWLHWDPRTVAERGASALARFRMDFLMLYPNGVRVVLEVDGKHHYADKNGRADGIRYSEMVAADRDLMLAGYFVFRFGAEELLSVDVEPRLRAFFSGLHRRFGISMSD